MGMNDKRDITSIDFQRNRQTSPSQSTYSEQPLSRETNVQRVNLNLGPKEAKHQEFPAHWESPEKGLTVYLPSETFNERSPHRKAKRFLTEALAAWTAVSHGKVTLIQVDVLVPETPDIQFHWTNETNPQRQYEVGRTESLKKNSFITHSDIYLQRDPIIYGHLSPHEEEAQFLSTLLHELGHALGLEHTQHPHSVMYYRSLQNTRITPEDTAQLQRLYSG